MANENNPTMITYKRFHITTNPQRQQTVPVLWDHALIMVNLHASHQQQVAYHNQFYQHQVAPLKYQDTSILINNRKLS